ncbi:MAG TPA: CBS domain-containing protein [Gammaproteobacteria bacterium]|nr:CBS domain-containing protein [Gammaproteobacteria bacterium]
MSVPYRALEFSDLEPGTTCYRSPQPRRRIGMDDPAAAVMTDFRDVQPWTVRPEATIDEALKVMKTVHVRMLLVEAPDGALEGLITARDINGEKPISLIRARGEPRSRILVRDIMVPARRVHALAMREIQRARVGDIVATLKRLGEQHIIVTERLEGGPSVCGVFSATEIARRLRVQFDIMSGARSFAELEQALVR